MKFYRKLRTFEHCPVGKKLSANNCCVTFVRFYFASNLRAFFLCGYRCLRSWRERTKMVLWMGLFRPSPRKDSPTVKKDSNYSAKNLNCYESPNCLNSPNCYECPTGNIKNQFCGSDPVPYVFRSQGS
jgi:hypothetical protein